MCLPNQYLFYSIFNGALLSFLWDVSDFSVNHKLVTKSQTSKSTLSGAWVMDATHGFTAWRRWVIRLPRIKRCLFRMLQPSGTCLSSPLWSLRPWRRTLHLPRPSFRAHSKMQSSLHVFIDITFVRFLLMPLVSFVDSLLEKPCVTCRHCPLHRHPQSSPGSFLRTSWRRWMDFSSG